MKKTTGVNREKNIINDIQLINNSTEEMFLNKIKILAKIKSKVQ